MNRNDTRRLNLWWFLRRQCKILMWASLMLATAWALVPLMALHAADRDALNAACRSTTGCSAARLCAGWRDRQTSGGFEWRPRVDVCLTGAGTTEVVELPDGTAKRWVPAWLRPLLADTNYGRWENPP